MRLSVVQACWGWQRPVCYSDWGVVSNTIYYVRSARADDMKAMLTLLKDLFTIEKDFSFNRVKQQAGLRRLLKQPDAVILVVERDNRIVGMCSVQTVISTAEGGLCGLLEDMIVHEKFRGQGIGRKLLAAAERWAVKNKLSRLHLLADSGNESALRFYASRGWQRTSLICWRKFTTYKRQ